jgi:hypothetical protein
LALIVLYYVPVLSAVILRAVDNHQHNLFVYLFYLYMPLHMQNNYSESIFDENVATVPFKVPVKVPPLKGLVLSVAFPELFA